MLTPQEIELERVDFEAWAKKRSMDLSGSKDKRKWYKTLPTFYAWQSWLARAEQAKRDNEAKEAKQ